MPEHIGLMKIIMKHKCNIFSLQKLRTMHHSTYYGIHTSVFTKLHKKMKHKTTKINEQSLMTARWLFFLPAIKQIVYNWLALKANL